MIRWVLYLGIEGDATKCILERGLVVRFWVIFRDFNWCGGVVCGIMVTKSE